MKLTYIKKGFRRAIKVAYNNRKYAFAMLGLIFISAIFGFLKPHLFADQQKQIVENLVSMTRGKGFFELAIIIMENNIRAALMALILGVFIGLMPIFASVLNGYFVGSIMHGTFKSAGSQAFLLLVPHGVFELPALALAFGLGLKMGLWILEKKKIDYLRKTFSDSMHVFFYIIVPLLILAAVIESALIHLL